MNVGSGDIVPTGFPEKKTGRPSGVLRGAPPKRLFASFLHAEKGCGRAFDIPFSRIAFFMRGHMDRKFGLRATFFLNAKKAGLTAVKIIRGLPRPSQMLPHLPEANRVGTGKEAPRVTPLDPPGILIFRAIVGHHNGR